MTTDKTKSNSRLAKHLQILDLEQSNFSERELKAERDGISSMRPPALNLDSVSISSSPQITRKKTSVWYAVAAAALAAVLTLTFYIPKEADDGFRVKGQGSVRIYAEEAGKVFEWDKKTPLASGARVRVEFKATEDVVAYLGVIGRDQADLLPVGMIWDRKLSLLKGEVVRSEGSIELTGSDEGETILAVTCPANLALANSEAFAQFWQEAKSAAKVKADRVKGCLVEAIALR
jgi:hypothetical protein